MIIFKARKKQRGSLAGPRPGSWALTPDQRAGRQPCDCLGSPPLTASRLRWNRPIFCGGVDVPPPIFVSRAQGGHLLPPPSPLPLPPISAVLSGRKESEVPGSSFSLTPCVWKFPMTALALLVPCPSGVPTTQGLKPREPHSLSGSLALIKAFSA